MNSRQDESLKRADSWTRQFAEQLDLTRTALRDFQEERKVDVERLNTRMLRLGEYYDAVLQSLKEVRAVTHQSFNENSFLLNEQIIERTYRRGNPLRQAGTTVPETEPLQRDIQEKFERKQQ